MKRKMTFGLFLRKLRTIFLWIVLLFFGSTIFFVLLYKWVPVSYTPLMGIRYLQQKSNGEKPRCIHKWIPLEEMPKDLPVAVMASEDQKFLVHSGFDTEAIQQAIQEADEGKRRRGASTISQQTAKNVFLWPNSSWVRKGFEVYFTFLIEQIWGKERIMEVYLNSIEMGDGIYGAEAVAEEHFDRKARALTKKQCATIAATLPNPLKHNSGKPDKYTRVNSQRIMKQMPFVSRLWDNRDDEKRVQGLIDGTQK